MAILLVVLHLSSLPLTLKSDINEARMSEIVVRVASSKKCSGCRLVQYCAFACQKAHWKAEHKEGQKGRGATPRSESWRPDQRLCRGSQPLMQAFALVGTARGVIIIYFNGFCVCWCCDVSLRREVATQFLWPDFAKLPFCGTRKEGDQ